MKLLDFKREYEYVFTLYFEDSIKIKTDLKELISHKVSINELNSAQINSDWHCLEFNDGLVDIEPNTLFNYAKNKEF